ncbi:MAG: TolC family protein [Spirochaeta sp.]|nr:TolC family protein [Spirochaeta sp.]
MLKERTRGSDWAATALFVLTFAAGGLFGPAIAPIPALTFDEIINRIDEAAAVQTANLDHLAAEQRLLSAEHPGATEFGIVPATVFQTAEGESFSDQTRVSASVTADVPLGLSRDRRAVADGARDDVVRALVAEERVRAETYADLLILYRAAWLAQRETAVLGAELDAAQEMARTVEERFSRGSASLNDINAAQDELVEAEIAYREGTLAQRLTWLELVYAAGLEQNRDEPLDAPDVAVPDIPRPPELVAWAVQNDPRIVTAQDAATGYARESAAVDGIIGAPTVRAGFSGWDQSASLSFNTEAPSMGLSYGFPVTTIGDLADARGSSTDIDTWELSLSITLPLRTPGPSVLERELLQTQQTRSSVDIVAIERELALTVRSRYQQYELAGEIIRDAERSVSFTAGVLETVRERAGDGNATSADLLTAEAQYERALFRRDAAIVDRENAKLTTARTATYLVQLIGSELQ